MTAVSPLVRLDLSKVHLDWVSDIDISLHDMFQNHTYKINFLRSFFIPAAESGQAGNPSHHGQPLSGSQL